MAIAMAATVQTQEKGIEHAQRSHHRSCAKPLVSIKNIKSTQIFLYLKNVNNTNYQYRACSVAIAAAAATVHTLFRSL
jgi:hypothetical protein